MDRYGIINIVAGSQPQVAASLGAFFPRLRSSTSDRAAHGRSWKDTRGATERLRLPGSAFFPQILNSGQQVCDNS